MFVKCPKCGGTVRVVKLGPAGRQVDGYMKHDLPARRGQVRVEVCEMSEQPLVGQFQQSPADRVVLHDRESRKERVRYAWERVKKKSR